MPDKSYEEKLAIIHTREEARRAELDRQARTGEVPGHRLGTIRGRHDLPVHEYLVESVEPGQGAYDAVFYAAARWREAHPGADVNLFYTGLTEATLAAIDGLNYAVRGNRGLVWLWRWDATTSTYQCLRRGPAEAGWSPAPPRSGRSGPPEYPSAQQLRDEADDTHESIFRR